MSYPNCMLFGYDQSRIDEMLRLLEISERDIDTAYSLHSDVIDPNLEAIIGSFYDYLQAHPEFQAFFKPGEQLTRMAQTQEAYLLSLGINFHSPDYFENRLQIGVTHNRIGLPPRLYECAYVKLKHLIVDQISDEIAEDEQRKIHDFLNRIIALDISLALESYYQVQVDNLQGSLDELRESKEQLQQRSLIDALTGANTRAAVLSVINKLVRQYQSDGSIFSVVMCDVDDLGSVNDRLGHMAGDLILKKLVEQIKSRIRNKDMIGRYGGDEFLIVLRDTGENDAGKIMQNINEHLINQALKVGDTELNLHMSYGVTNIQENDTLPGLLQRVDQDLLQAKGAKKE